VGQPPRLNRTASLGHLPDRVSRRRHPWLGHHSDRLRVGSLARGRRPAQPAPPVVSPRAAQRAGPPVRAATTSLRPRPASCRSGRRASSARRTPAPGDLPTH